MSRLITALLFFGAAALNAAELEITLANAPATGQLIVQVYAEADAFGDFRDPAIEQVIPANGAGPYVIGDAPSGPVAVVVVVDENTNGIIDKNFIGIPREPLAFSNDYRPKGPPSFTLARLDLAPDESRRLTMEIYRVLGNRGRWGVGVGVVGRSNPYVGADGNVMQAIPAVTYVGERLQWFGPTLRYGLLGSGRARLALTADYRLRAYDEDDATSLAGLGDREDTLMAGLGVQLELGRGFELEAGYQHDILDRIGGGSANVRLERAFPTGIVRWTPQLSFNWLSADLANHDFGVDAVSARPDRPAYEPGSTTSVELGIGAFIELSENWRIIMDVAVERFSSEVTRSPILDDDRVVKGFATVTYVF